MTGFWSPCSCAGLSSPVLLTVNAGCLGPARLPTPWNEFKECSGFYLGSRLLLVLWPENFLQLVSCDSGKFLLLQSLMDQRPLLPD